MALVVPPTPVKTEGPKPQSTAELFAQSGREFILLAGKDGAGKSSAMVSMAWFVQNVLNPGAKFYIIDTENKLPTALRSFGADAPTNIVYFKCETMNHVTDAIDVVMEQRKAGDWLGVESMSRAWERSQDLGYMAVCGYDKATYLEKRRKMSGNKAAVIPSPDNFWNVVKGAHDGAFLDQMSQAVSLNVMLTTTISKPPKNDSFIKENATRKEARIEFGLDAGLDGAPRLPYYVETLALLDSKEGKIVCRVVRDNPSKLDNPKAEFEVDGKKAWGMTFYSTCRG